METRAWNNLPAYVEFANVFPEAVLLLSGGGEILAANQPAAAMLGAGVRELRGKSLYDLTTNPPEDVDRRLKTWARTGTLIPGSLTWKAAGGRVVDCRCDGAVVQPPEKDRAVVILLRCTPRAASNNKFLELERDLESLRDEYRRVYRINARLEERVEERTTQLVRYTERLRKSREWFRSIIKSTSDIIWVTTADGTLSYISPSIERSLGYRPEDLIGTFGFDLIHPDDVARAQSFYDDILESPDAIPPVEFRLRRKDGSWCPVESTGSNLLQDPSVLGVVFHSREITDRKRAEEEETRRTRLATLRADVSVAFAEDGALHGILQRCMEAMVRHWDVACARLWTVVEEEDVLELQASAGLYTHLDGSHDRVSVEEFKIGLVARERRPHLTNDVLGDPRIHDKEWARREGMVAFAGHPLVVEDRLVGVMAVFAREPLGEDTIEAFASVADTIAQGIDRKRAEEELRRQKELYQKVLKAQSELDEGVIIVEEQRVRYANEAYCRMSGYSLEDLEALPDVMELVPEEERPLLLQRQRRRLSGEEVETCYETALRHKSGRRVEVEVALNILEGDGSPNYLALVRDITDRHRAENNLRESQVRLAEAQRIAHLGNWDTDLITGQMYWSDEMYRIFGFAPGEITPTREIIEKVTHPDDRELVQEAIRNAVKRREPFDIDHRVLHANGEVRFVQARGEAVFGPDGKPVKLVGTSLDITERKRAEEQVRESESRLLSAQRLAHVGDWTFDVINNEAHWSDEMYRIFGLDSHEEATMTYRKFLSLVHPDDRALVQEASREALEGGTRNSIDYRAVRPDGEVRFVHSLYEVRYDPSGRALELAGTLQDVTEQHRAQEALHRSEERFRSLAENASDIVTIIGADGTTLYVSPAVERILGYRPEELAGKNARAIPIHPDDLPYALGKFDQVAAHPGVNYSMEVRFRHADGSWRWVESISKNLIDDPTIGGIVVNYRDITERRAFEENLAHQAFHDDLTDLPNRALFMDHLEHALASLERGRDEAIAVLFIDLDDFKVINNSLGHAAGDRLLIGVAKRLRSFISPEHMVARFGGDEFMVFLKGVKEVGDAARIAERILDELRKAFTLGAREVVVSPSIGISLGATAADRAGDLLRKADTALHEAKGRGKARYAVFDSEMHATVAKRLKMEGDLRRALERGEFRVYYQPKLRLSINLQHSLRVLGSQAIIARNRQAAEAPRIVSTEALIRWEHPDAGLIYPDAFVPVAEETGLIVEIGRRVMREACLHTRRWNEQCPPDSPLTVCVNLSARQLQHPGLTRDVARILQETGLDPRCLCLELTESVLMEEAQSTIGMLEELRALGVELSVDDFGTGYSSLAYLKRFPVNYLKIDHSFVDELKREAGDSMLVAGIIRLAHSLGMQVVAEGVESAAQLKRLQGLGCDLVQGFYFSEALPGEAMPEFLVAARRKGGRA